MADRNGAPLRPGDRVMIHDGLKPSLGTVIGPAPGGYLVATDGLAPGALSPSVVAGLDQLYAGVRDHLGGDGTVPDGSYEDVWPGEQLERVDGC